MLGKCVLAVVILAVGLVALPSTVSLFAGQHYWYDIDCRKSEIPCEKCHADIYEELKNSGHHRKMECRHCHRSVNVTYASGYSNTPGREAHAATTVSCLYCHGSLGIYHTYADIQGTDCKTCHDTKPGGNIEIPSAGGFGVTADSSDTGIYAAHRDFVLAAKNSSMMVSANEACIACHTHVAVKIKWNHSRSLEFSVGFGTPITTNNGPHNWTITGWSINGTAKATVWGNTTGNGSTAYSADNWPGEVPDVGYT